MINQAAVEALYSANYVVNYTDCVENLPDEIQRLVSRIRELDVTYQSYLKEVELHQPIASHPEDDHTRKRTYQRIQKALIAAQEVGDEKLQVGQLIQDLIENKVRQLDTDYKNLDLSKDQENTEPNKETPHHHNISNVREPSNASTSATPTGGERQSKRARRSRVDTITNLDTVIPPEILATPEPSITRGNAAVVAAAATNNNTNNNNSSNAKKNSTGKKKKRKARQSQQSQQQQQQQQRDDSPPREDELAIDPDEPTYCLCDQISYGEMILCDNDLCPIEWFHFSCVSLATKPKGKWFCPKCRGDRPNIMKPKGQFLKELERYNKEKEEKA